MMQAEFSEEQIAFVLNFTLKMEAAWSSEIVGSHLQERTVCLLVLYEVDL
jgi:hypothetical protein